MAQQPQSDENVRLKPFLHNEILIIYPKVGRSSKDPIITLEQKPQPEQTSSGNQVHNDNDDYDAETEDEVESNTNIIQELRVVDKDSENLGKLVDQYILFGRDSLKTLWKDNRSLSTWISWQKRKFAKGTLSDNIREKFVIMGLLN